jgi:hypothetical protein
MHAYIITVTAGTGEYRFPLISLTESRAPHSIAQEIVNVRRDSILNQHRYAIRDALRAAHDEWDVPLIPLDDGDTITITDNRQGVHRFYVSDGWASKVEPRTVEAVVAPYVPRPALSAHRYPAAKLSAYNRSVDV